MRNITSIFLNIFLIILFLVSIVIVFTENVSSFDNKIIQNIELQLDSKLNAKSNIKSIDIKWSGIKPKILIKNLSLFSKKNETLLNTPLSELEINIINSLTTGMISIERVTIYNTSINLKYDNTNISFNNLDLLKKSDKTDSGNIPLINFNNSILKLTNRVTKKSEIFKIDKFIASFNNNSFNINTRFLHESSVEPITLIYKGEYEKLVLNSKIFLSANSIKLPYNILPESIKQLYADRMSLRIWISMTKNSIKKVVGNISSDNLNLRLNNQILKIQNINSDLLFLNNGKSSTLGLMRMNYNIQNQKITNNKIVINKNSNNAIKIFIKKSDNHVLRLMTRGTFIKNIKTIDQLIKGNINNLQIHLSGINLLDYFSFSLEKLDLNYKERYFANDISADIQGNLNSGRIYLKNANISIGDISIEELSGSLSYSTKGKSIYFSSSSIKNKQGHNLTFTGNKVSALPTLKIKITTSLDKIINSVNNKKFENIKSNAVIESNIYFHDGNIFTANKIKDFYFNVSESTYISSKSLEIFSSSNIVSSNKFNLSLNDQKQSSKINTNTSPKSYQYTLTSIGNIKSITMHDIFNTNKETFDGQAIFKSILSYNYNTNEMSIYSSSDLSGISLNVIKPWSKQKTKKVNFVINYQHFPKKSFPLKINLDKNEFEFKNLKNNTYIKIKSPAARGILKYPVNKSEENIFSGSFEYIDMTYFSSDRLIDYFPMIDIQSKHVKTANTVFDNVHLIMSPKAEYIEITRLDFNNLNLEMYSKGKWYLGDNQTTAITANIKSDNFGKALKGLGYPNTIKGGVMNANVDCKWDGSLEDFSFALANGKIELNIKDGQINELDKGTQAIGQVLGLFSIASIPKRLSLDFSDFFSKGLSFDDLNSEITLNSGIANTKKMIILGSFGEMRLSGKSNLVERTHDQTLIFIPDLSSTSLVTGAVIGGPIGAAASIFYDKLLKEFGVDTNKLAGIEYSIKGSWDDPEIKVTQSFKPIIN